MTDTIKIPLIETPDSYVLKTRKWLRLAWPILIIVAAITFTYQSVYLGIRPDGSVIFNFFILPIFIIGIGLAQQPSYIKFKSDAIHYKKNIFKPTTIIPLTTISDIRIDFTDVVITTKTGKTYQIEIGAAKHSDIGVIKSKLREIQF